MPQTQINSNQIRSVAPEDVSRIERRFFWFFGCSSVILIGLLSGIVMDIPPAFWQKNILWSLGSAMVCISVSHNRFVDIKKKVAPHNERIDAASLSVIAKILETVCVHAWMVGFALLAVSRWANF